MPLSPHRAVLARAVQFPLIPPHTPPESKSRRASEAGNDDVPVRVHAGDLVRHAPSPPGQPRRQLASSRSHRRAQDQPDEIRLAVRLEALRDRLAVVDARLVQLRAARRASTGGTLRTLARGAGVGLQAALRELVPQAAGQAVAMTVTGALDAWAGQADQGRWAAPLVAGGTTLVAGLYFGRRAAALLAAGELVPATPLATRSVTALPLALEALALCVAGGTGGRAAAWTLATDTAGSRVGSVTSALLSQLQAGAWATATPVTRDGQPAPTRRILQDMEPCRVAALTALHTLASVVLLTFMADWLGQRLGDSTQARDTAGAVCKVMLELLLAFLGALVMACAAARAGLALDVRGGQARHLAVNLRHPAATWDRVRSQAGVRIWMRSVTSALPAALRPLSRAAGVSAQAVGLDEARVNGWMALRGWVAERPATIRALAQERQQEAIARGLDQVQAQQADGKFPATRLRLVYGLRGDGQFDVLVEPVPEADTGPD